MTRAILFIASILLSISPSLGRAEGSVQGSLSFVSTDGNGRTSVAYAGEDGKTVNITTNSVTQSFAFDSAVQTIQLIDAPGYEDGKVDLLVTFGRMASYPILLLGDGQGKFSLAPNFIQPIFPAALAISAYDYVLPIGVSGRYRIVRSIKGDGVKTKQSSYLAQVDFPNAQLMVLDTLGLPPAILSTSNYGSGPVISGDLDGDGYNDLVNICEGKYVWTTRYDQYGPISNFLTTAPIVTYNTAGSPSNLVLTDTIPEIVYKNTFLSAFPALGDLNGDGSTDVAELIASGTSLDGYAPLNKVIFRMNRGGRITDASASVILPSSLNAYLLELYHVQSGRLASSETNDGFAMLFPDSTTPTTKKNFRLMYTKYNPTTPGGIDLVLNADLTGLPAELSNANFDGFEDYNSDGVLDLRFRRGSSKTPGSTEELWHLVTIAKTPTIDLSNSLIYIEDVTGKSLYLKFNSAAVVGARVDLNGRTKYTDTYGNFFFRNVPPGSHPLTISKSGYEVIKSFNVPLYVSAGVVNRTDRYMSPLVDTDGDGTTDENDQCPQDKAKSSPGACGCGVSDTDSNRNGVADCKDRGSGGSSEVDVTNLSLSKPTLRRTNPTVTVTMRTVSNVKYYVSYSITRRVRNKKEVTAKVAVWNSSTGKIRGLKAGDSLRVRYRVMSGVKSSSFSPTAGLVIKKL